MFFFDFQAFFNRQLIIYLFLFYPSLQQINDTLFIYQMLVNPKGPVVITLQKVQNGYEIIANQNDFKTHLPSDIYSSKKSRVNIPPPIPKPRILPQPEIKPQEQQKDWFLQNWDLILPASARWFKLEHIHQIERDALPEFFHSAFHQDYSYQKGNYKTPSMYLKRRNQIIMKWISTQDKYLKFSDVLNIMGGDAASLLRIYYFLEHWGLINFQYQANNLPNQGYVLQQNESFLERIKVNFQNSNCQFHDTLQERCDICNSLTTTMYKQKKESMAQFQLTQLIICSVCVSKKIYPSFLKIGDFKNLSQKLRQSWTQRELWQLLELVLKYKEKWNEIAKHFPKRTLTEIVKTYLQIPFLGIFPSMNSEIHTRIPKEQITFHNDQSNPIQLGVACFKYQLDMLEPKNFNEFPKQEECPEYPMKDIIEIQMTKLGQKLDYLQSYEEQVSQEKQQILLYNKMNLSLIVQMQGNSNEMYL
ncbi:hypothetical protein pb186bvf_004835 [Paramecium bursaria]